VQLSYTKTSIRLIVPIDYSHAAVGECALVHVPFHDSSSVLIYAMAN